MVRVMVWLMCTTGLRVGESLGLQCSSIDWDEKRTRVEKDRTDVELSSPKTKPSEASVKMTEEDVEILT